MNGNKEKTTLSCQLYLAGQSPKTSCDDWPQETVMLIAEKHYGACKYSGGNYCTEVWEMYKSRNHFEENAEAKKLLETVKGYSVTR